MMNCPHGKMVVRSEEYFQGLFKRELLERTLTWLILQKHNVSANLGNSIIGYSSNWRCDIWPYESNYDEVDYV